MFISPLEAIKNGWIQKVGLSEKFIQPNGIDFTLDRVFAADGDDSFTLSEQVRHHKKSVELQPESGQFQGSEPEDFFLLQPRTSYDCNSSFYVEIPEHVSALLIIRSSLNRNGMFLTSGLYDSGFKGHIGFYLHNNAKTPAAIAKGTRVGQIMFVRSESASMYSGHYNHDVGAFWQQVPLQTAAAAVPIHPYSEPKWIGGPYTADPNQPYAVELPNINGCNPPGEFKVLYGGGEGV